MDVPGDGWRGEGQDRMNWYRECWVLGVVSCRCVNLDGSKARLVTVKDRGPNEAKWKKRKSKKTDGLTRLRPALVSSSCNCDLVM
jgi:hypothetical protein